MDRTRLLINSNIEKTLLDLLHFCHQYFHVVQAATVAPNQGCELGHYSHHQEMNLSLLVHFVCSYLECHSLCLQNNTSTFRKNILHSWPQGLGHNQHSTRKRSEIKDTIPFKLSKVKIRKYYRMFRILETHFENILGIIQEYSSSTRDIHEHAH